MLERANGYFLALLAQTQEALDIRAQHDVFSQKGQLLIARGARLDAESLGRLESQRLRQPLELALQLDDSTLPQRLCSEFKQMLQQDPLVCAWLGSELSRELQRFLAYQVWPLPIAQMLQLLATAYPSLLRHHLRVLAIAWVLLGKRGQQRSVLFGALLHDVGYLYLNPAVWQKDGPLTPEEWLLFDSHPLTGFVWACELQAVPPDVSNIILMHHERIDGSGYPRQLRADNLGQTAELIAMAEMIAGLFEHACWPVNQLRMSLRLLPGQFSPAMRLDAMQRAMSLPVESVPLMAENMLETALHQLLMRFAHAHEVLLQIEEQLHSDTARQLHVYLMTRLLAIQQAFNSVGLGMLQFRQSALAEEEENGIWQELVLVITETNWLTRHLSRDLLRQRQKLPAADSELFEPLAVLFIALSEALTLSGS